MAALRPANLRPAGIFAGAPIFAPLPLYQIPYSTYGQINLATAPAASYQFPYGEPGQTPTTPCTSSCRRRYAGKSLSQYGKPFFTLFQQMILCECPDRNHITIGQKVSLRILPKVSAHENATTIKLLLNLDADDALRFEDEAGRIVCPDWQELRRKRKIMVFVWRRHTEFLKELVIENEKRGWELYEDVRLNDGWVSGKEDWCVKDNCSCSKCMVRREEAAFEHDVLQEFLREVATDSLSGQLAVYAGMEIDVNEEGNPDIEQLVEAHDHHWGRLFPISPPKPDRRLVRRERISKRTEGLPSARNYRRAAARLRKMR